MSMTSNPREGDEFATNLATVIRTLMRFRGIKTSEAYERLHVSKGTWFSHMRTGSFSARHIAELADMLDVPVQDLYGDPAELIRSRCFPALSLVEDLGDVDTPSSTPEIDWTERPFPKRPSLSVVPQ